MKKYIGRLAALTTIIISGFVSANTQTGFNSGSRQYFNGDPYFNAPIVGPVNFTALEAESGVQLTPHTAFRMNRSQLSTNMVGSVSSASYSLSAHALNQGMIFDWTPSKKFPLKLSAGMYQNALNAIGTAMLKNNIAISTQVTKNVTTKVGKKTVTQAVTRTVTTNITPEQVGALDVSVNYTNSVAPYFGFGWGKTYLQKRVIMSFDAGVIYVGNIDVAVSSKNSQYANLPVVQDRISQQSAQLESSYTAKYIPVATLAMTYRF